jgi:cysteine synthase
MSLSATKTHIGRTSHTTLSMSKVTLRCGGAVKRTLSARFSSQMARVTYNDAAKDLFPLRGLTLAGKEELFRTGNNFNGVVVPQFGKLEKLVYPPSQLEIASPIGARLPFEIPASSILSNVGNTPITQIEPGVWAKLEGFNFSGSIKDRAVTNMVLNMFADGKLKDGSTLVLITSGSAGLSLAHVQKALQEDCGVDLRTIIIMPKAYQQKSACQKMSVAGVPTFYDEADPEAKSQLLLLDGVFMDVMNEGKALAADNGYAVLDQHYDDNSYLAHKNTAIELLAQMPDVTDVVCATGTGATAAGLRSFLPADVVVHSRASESGAIDGLSDINRYDNFCDASKLSNYRASLFEREVAIQHQEMLLQDHELNCGMSTGAKRTSAA